ncbi:hypothetical protein R6L23_20755 [Streptomyces sp. SR27]|nr:hypothetical protein [Streptomyces sp. SR27]MDV9190612.1 hypothetical protein [Streptomyces sp. SR27]
MIVLTGVFRLDLTDVDATARAELWHRVRSAHEQWDAEERR